MTTKNKISYTDTDELMNFMREIKDVMNEMIGLIDKLSDLGERDGRNSQFVRLYIVNHFKALTSDMYGFPDMNLSTWLERLQDVIEQDNWDEEVEESWEEYGDTEGSGAPNDNKEANNHAS